MPKKHMNITYRGKEYMDQQNVVTKTSDVSCNGGNPPYDHPLVYLTITAQEVICPYCSKKFTLDDKGAI